jgi:hypothetical protein
MTFIASHLLIAILGQQWQERDMGAKATWHSQTFRDTLQHQHCKCSMSQPCKISFILLMTSHENDKKSDDKHCLNSVAILVLKIKSIHAACFMKVNVYLLQEV